MKHDSVAPAKRRPVNVSLDTGIVAAAREAGVNLSRVTEAALRVAIKEARERQWREDNQAAIGRFADWYERNGDPLAHLEPR
jgi:antitoxin CcdA